MYKWSKITKWYAGTLQEIRANVSKRLSSVEQTVQTMVINFGLEKSPSTLEPLASVHNEGLSSVTSDLQQLNFDFCSP